MGVPSGRGRAHGSAPSFRCRDSEAGVYRYRFSLYPRPTAQLAAATEGETGKPEKSKEHGGWLRNAEGNLTETDAITTRRRTKSAVGKVV